ncbi:MAG TPA: protein kinase [Kiritimatiellia bacterium]|nr:protein kinase [Kiritimatiellia bacterium]
MERFVQPENTARIQVPPTERLAAPAQDETQTVRVVPGEGTSHYEEPGNDKLFDQYTIYSKIGNGGMGVVYLARDRRLGRFVAIKRLNHQAQSIPTLRQRFLHEARAVAVLSHVHIVHIYALGEDEDGPFIVMEYIAGPDRPDVVSEMPPGGLLQPNPPLTLDQYVSQHGQLSVDEAIELVLKIGRAVAYAHASGVIHRDLKPSNILMDKSGEPKIVDFGLARLMSKEEAKLTVPGEKLLSLGYGAPEQESDASQSDERADVYGLGALLYFVLTGQNPRYFREQDIPVSLRDVVVKALATDKEQRWESAAAFNTALYQIQSKTQIETPTVKTTWRCKWCDAVNPLAIKFCAECGWDGSEACPECGADTFVGVQYCGTCGADARAYESVLHLLQKMRDSDTQQRFDRVIAHAGRVHGFEPAGPSGRAYLQEVTELRALAEKKMRRRDQLKEQIPIEIRAENFERAEEFIRQYRELTEDRQGFENELRQIPERILLRDLQRAQRALKQREWDSAARLCGTLLREVAPDHPDVLRIRKAIRIHTAVANLRIACAITLGMMVLYLLSLPVAVTLADRSFGTLARGFYRPARWVYERSLARVPLQAYARLWLGAPPEWNVYFATASEEPVLPGEVQPTPQPDALAQKQREYARQLAELDARQEKFQRAWPTEYVRELDLLMERCRTAGDFEGWDVAQTERRRFDETRQMNDAVVEGLSELNTLKTKYRQMLSEQRLQHSRKWVTLCKKYVNDLTDMQRKFMQEGRMDLASAVNAEIRKARNAPPALAAEAVVAAAELAGMSETETAPMLLGGSDQHRVEEIAQLRSGFESELAAVEKDAVRKATAWPDQYVQGLTELMESFQRAGDYVGWESARDELGRFEADRAIQQRHFVLQPAGLVELQKKFFLLREENRRKRAEQLVDTTEKYVKKLQDVQKKLTVGGQMETAAAVNAEIKRVRTRVDYIEAQNELSPPQGPPVPPAVWPKTEPAAGGNG